MAFVQLLTGFGVAIAVALVGVILAVCVQVGRAYLDPKRRSVITHRSLRDNIHHMLS